ncbi:HAD hydrolase-like protein, partial [candidate division KSB1 bacterium]|nr:HAD hydrolase-like protein [candidate division KSB1 bacterium]
STILSLKAVLFDLDNTLILFQETRFYESYNRALYAYFKDIMKPDEFAEKLLHSTHKIVENDGSLTNLEHFMNSFASGDSQDKDDILKRFETFYENEFAQFQSLMNPAEGAREVMEHSIDSGLKLVIATNPMFPLNVQQMRIDWAGVGDLSFELITSVENSTYCKPNLQYYLEITNKIDVSPDQCLMVGNDPFNDMIASKTGMKTYLTTDSDEMSIELSRELAKGKNIEMPKPDFKGQLKDVIPAIDKLT